MTPAASKTSALPLGPVPLRLPCLATRAPGGAAMKAAAVEMLNSLAPLPPVPQVSTRWSAGASTRVESWRMVAAAPAISSGVSPFMRKAMSRAPICAGVASPDITWRNTELASVG